MAKRLPSQPPVLSGFTFIRALGTGGFSDVYLYAQDLPRREVAVKVMLPRADDTDMVKMFTTEADALAKLALHPAIVSVYEAGRAADGRPYLVMEYCPDSYAKVFREYVLSVPEALDVGVQMAGALESVHRAGLLHRDIKPSNILRTVSGSPVLSDFGVASTRFFSEYQDRIAMSIPWGAPEIISEAVVGSVTADVWSLGATVYSLLAGKSPFERDGEGANTPERLKQRIRMAKYTSVGREDVPPELETVLARSMSLQPTSRQSSAEAFGQQLQEVQQLLNLPVTELEILGADSLTGSVRSMAAFGGVANRMPRQVTVGHEPRSRRGAAGGSAVSAPSPGRDTDDIPNSASKPKMSPLLAFTLAGVGVVALVAAVLIVTLGR